MQWLKTEGKLKYDPVRGEDFRKKHKSRTLIVELPRDQMDLYYIWFLQKKFGTFLHLDRPMFGLHVTVVSGKERVPRPEFWKKYEGEKIEIEYGVELRKNWQFWTLPVKANLKLTAVRAELGLPAGYHFHITVARLNQDWQEDYFKKG